MLTRFGTDGLSAPEETLDPADWDATRALAHRMMDDMLDWLETVRDRPVWQPMPAETQGRFQRAVAAGRNAG